MSAAQVSVISAGYQVLWVASHFQRDYSFRYEQRKLDCICNVFPGLRHFRTTCGWYNTIVYSACGESVYEYKMGSFNLPIRLDLADIPSILYCL